MYYEVYIDVMFLVNFMMDVLILFSVKALMKMPGSMKRVIAGGLVGSGPVSYTHLDVYKRQSIIRRGFIMEERSPHRSFAVFLTMSFHISGLKNSR